MSINGTAVICSTEKRAFFNGISLAPTGGIMPQSERSPIRKPGIPQARLGNHRSIHFASPLSRFWGLGHLNERSVASDNAVPRQVGPQRVTANGGIEPVQRADDLQEILETVVALG